MTKHPLISVIIPVYNGEKTIAETITSVFNQTFSDFELVIINDGSTDSTIDIVTNFKDNRIRIFNFENEGLSESRNRGIRHANGQYISFIDADDLWAKDKLEKQINALKENPNSGVAYSWTLFIDTDGKIIHPVEAADYCGNLLKHLLVANFIASGSNILVHKDAIDSIGFFDTSLKSAEDWDYYIRLAFKWDFVVVPEYQIYYRRSNVSMSSDIEKIEEFALKVVEKSYSNISNGLYRLKKTSIANCKLYSSYLYLTKNPGEDWIRYSKEKMTEAIKMDNGILFSRRAINLLIINILLTFIPKRYSVSSTRYYYYIGGKILMNLKKIHIKGR